MRGRTHWLGVIFLSLLIAGCASAPPLPPPTPQKDRASVGLSVHIHPILSFGSPYSAQVVYFARVGGTGEPDTSVLYASSFHKDGRVYLLNAPPGRYVALAATVRDEGLGPSGGLVTYFPRSLVEQTQVDASADTLAFAGRYVVRQKLGVCPDNADDLQLRVAELLAPGEPKCGFLKTLLYNVLTTDLVIIGGHAYAAGPFTFHYSGTLLEAARGPDDEREFLRAAQEDLREAGWVISDTRAVLVPVPTEAAAGAPVSTPVSPAPPPGRTAPVIRDRLTDGSTGPEMVFIQGGGFQMGSPTSEEDRDDNERQHLVRVGGFYIGKYEVTVGEFRRFVEASGYQTDAERNAYRIGCKSETKPRSGFYAAEYQAGRSWRSPGSAQGDDHPVVCVSWNDALAYTQWLAQNTGKPYRLPTRAEWEYAARAGTESARFWGNNPSDACRYANVWDATAKRTYKGKEFHDCDDGALYTAPVGSYTPNPWGLYDMLGNVWEWTCSAWDETWGGDETLCETSADSRAAGGGSWYNTPSLVRSAFKGFGKQVARNAAYGFRLARDSR